MSCSWTGVSMTCRAGSECTRIRIRLLMTSSHAGTGLDPASARAIANGVSSRDFSRTSTMSFYDTR
jgi:hypothetical protein